MRTKSNTHRIAAESDVRSIGRPEIKANSLHGSPRLSRADLSTGEKRKLSVICGLSLILAILSMARAAHSASPGNEHQFVKSTFAHVPGAPGFGKDPFFPKSARFLGVVNTTTEVAPTPLTAFKVNGTSGPKNHRLAIINNRTFEVGEEAEMKVMGQSFHVKCIEIRDDGVVVSVNGQTQKLSLSSKL